MTPSWYDLLDVAPASSADEIRSAWRDAIADLEPGSRRFQTLNRAAEVLLDVESRAAYDAELALLAPADPEDVADPERAPEISESPTREAPRWEGSTTKPDAVPDAMTASSTERSVPTWILAALSCVLIALVAGCVWAYQAPSSTGPIAAISGESEEEATQAALAAAERAIGPVLSYDYETLDADQQRAASYLTGDYRRDYDDLFGVIVDNAPSTQTKVTASVVASGIVRSGEDRVDVLVFVDRPTTNKLTPEPVTYKDQVTVTMQKVGGEWLIDNLVTSPAAR